MRKTDDSNVSNRKILMRHHQKIQVSTVDVSEVGILFAIGTICVSGGLRVKSSDAVNYSCSVNSIKWVGDKKKLFYLLLFI